MNKEHINGCESMVLNHRPFEHRADTDHNKVSVLVALLVQPDAVVLKQWVLIQW